MRQGRVTSLSWLACMKGLAGEATGSSGGLRRDPRPMVPNRTRFASLPPALDVQAKEGVEDPRDFKWESQLRYYWEFHEQPPSGAARSDCLSVSTSMQHAAGFTVTRS